MVMFTFSVLDLLCKFCPKNPFGILMLPDYTPSSLLAETKPVAFLFQLKVENALQASNYYVRYLSLILISLADKIMLLRSSNKNLTF